MTTTTDRPTTGRKQDQEQRKDARLDVLARAAACKPDNDGRVIFSGFVVKATKDAENYYCAKAAANAWLFVLHGCPGPDELCVLAHKREGFVVPPYDHCETLLVGGRRVLLFLGSEPVEDQERRAKLRNEGYGAALAELAARVKLPAPAGEDA